MNRPGMVDIRIHQHTIRKLSSKAVRNAKRSEAFDHRTRREAQFNATASAEEIGKRTDAGLASFEGTEAQLADNELRAWILAAEIFRPGQFNLGQPLGLFVIYIDGLRAWKDEAIRAELELMEEEGLVRSEGGTYWSTYEGQVARERLLQAEGQRAACLSHQREHDVQDLVLALVIAPQVVGRIHDAEADDAIKVYLHERTTELTAAADALIESGYMTAVEGLGFREGSRGYYPSGDGMRRYDDVVRERLGIAKNVSILAPTPLADEKLNDNTPAKSELANTESVLNIGEVVRSGQEAYNVLAQVGAGGMGRVYSAERPDGKRVALKLLSSSRFEIGATERERFRREARIAREVDHPNLVRAFDVFEHGDLLVTVMELLPGENLEARLKMGRPAIEVGLRWMLELATGLGQLHAKRIVHRDISAKNALLRPDDTLAISDFGIARPIDDPTLTVGPGVFGSLIYISPQQREKPHDATFADDVFSLGQLFFYIATAINPHNTGPLSQHVHVYDQRVVDLIDSMRHHDRTKRPVDGNDVRFRLEACVQDREARRSGARRGLPTHQRSRGFAQRQQHRCLRRRNGSARKKSAPESCVNTCARSPRWSRPRRFRLSREAHEAIAEAATHVLLVERDLSTAYVSDPDLPRLASPLVSLTFKGSNRSIDLYRAHEGIDKWDSSATERARRLTETRTMLHPAWMVHEAGVTPWRTHGILLASSKPADPIADDFTIEVSGEGADPIAVTLGSPLDIKNHVFGLLERALIPAKAPHEATRTNTAFTEAVNIHHAAVAQKQKLDRERRESVESCAEALAAIYTRVIRDLDQIVVDAKALGVDVRGDVMFVSSSLLDSLMGLSTGENTILWNCTGSTAYGPVDIRLVAHYEPVHASVWPIEFKLVFPGREIPNARVYHRLDGTAVDHQGLSPIADALPRALEWILQAAMSVQAPTNR